MIRYFSLAGVNMDPIYGQNLTKLMENASQYPDTILDIRLIPEPENPYDVKAIRVDINRQPVGYIPKFETEVLHLQFGSHLSSWERIGIHAWGQFLTEDGPKLYCYIAVDCT